MQRTLGLRPWTESPMIATYAVLDSVAASAQSVILEVEQLESSMNIFDELADL